MEKEIIVSETVKEMDEGSEVENLKKIDAALFLSARALNLEELVMLTDINPLRLRELLARLIEKYNGDDSAIEIVVSGDSWKMDVKKDYFYMVNKLATGKAEFNRAEQETLAVIAFKQPVKQSVIINIRGNKAYEHIKRFIDGGLVKFKRIGHTKELRLSEDFYDYFHLQNNEGTKEIMEKVFEGIGGDDVGTIEGDEFGKDLDGNGEVNSIRENDESDGNKNNNDISNDNNS